MKRMLTKETLIREAIRFCEAESSVDHPSLYGVTDGKAVGTYIEQKFKSYLSARYDLNAGNSAKGLDLPGEELLTDIKVTSFSQPQSSCPFRSARQKVYGLGYNLLVMVYKKQDTDGSCAIRFVHCAFIESGRTADYTTTARLREMLSDGANKDDIIAYLEDRSLPGDESVYDALADEMIQNPPMQGYLTVSNALQWRLKYAHVMTLQNGVDGVINYDW